MSNAYINQVLFGHSKHAVDTEYIRGLMPLMLTTDYVLQELPVTVTVLQTKSDIKDPKPPEKETPSQPVFPKPRNSLNKNSLFWSIYEIENPEEAFLGTKANAEIAHRIKVIDELKKTPKILKETNSKLTIEQTQALFGKMLTAKEDNLDFCIAYAAYYKKPIVVVYEKTYRVFSPTVEVNISADEEPIVLYASKSGYNSEKNLTPDILQNITKKRILGPLRSMSSYKNPELDELAAFMQIHIQEPSFSFATPWVVAPENFPSPTPSGTPEIARSEKGSKGKRRPKEEIYNEIKVAIHNDMNFHIPA